MLYLLLFLAQLGTLFLLSRTLTRELSYMLHRITRNYKATVHIFSFLFLPGTFVHEMSHYLMATFLFVPTGTMTFTPRVDGATIRMGSVEIAKTDPIRRMFIGVAPVIFGTCLLLGSIVVGAMPQLTVSPWKFVLIGLIVFQVGNTMFASKKDLEGTLALFIMAVLLCIILFFAGVRIPPIDMQILISQQITTIIQKADLYLLIPLGVDLGIIGLLNLLVRR